MFATVEQKSLAFTMASLLHFAIEKGYETVKKQIVRCRNLKHQEIDLDRKRNNNNRIKKKKFARDDLIP